jgi:hypothetical protein
MAGDVSGGVPRRNLEKRGAALAQIRLGRGIAAAAQRLPLDIGQVNRAHDNSLLANSLI